MILSIILCICLLFIFTGLLFFMETEGAWNFTAVFSPDEKDLHTAKTEKVYHRKARLVAEIKKAENQDSASDTVYRNMTDCRILTAAYTITPDGSTPVCCGYGSCVKVCPQNAIIMVKDTAVIRESCNGCGICVGHCPLNLISLKEVAPESEKKTGFWFKFWKFWYTILRRDEADGSIALWE